MPPEYNDLTRENAWVIFALLTAAVAIMVIAWWAAVLIG